jgi:hypothetical protein
MTNIKEKVLQLKEEGKSLEDILSFINILFDEAEGIASEEIEAIYNEESTEEGSEEGSEEESTEEEGSEEGSEEDEDIDLAEYGYEEVIAEEDEYGFYFLSSLLPSKIVEGLDKVSK